jgi:2-polyprenyl-3-methyl-5-hydroxy-6-metoxy-1,4-benzoquinol methylase
MTLPAETPPGAKEYRQFVYNQYLTGHLGISSSMSETELIRRGRHYSWTLRRWLPANVDAAILEIGSGYGVLLKFLQLQGFTNLTGVDRSEDQVRVAQQNGLAVLQGDALTFLDGADRKFDCIFALDVIEHFTKAEVLSFLRGCSRLLEAEGRIILQTPNASSPWGMGLFFGDLTHETAFTPDLIRELLLTQGFAEVTFREVAPIPFGHSLLSSIRSMMWVVLRSFLLLCSLIETGRLTHRVMTRSFMVTAKRRNTL